MKRIKGYLEVKEGEVIGVASTESPDRDGEVIVQNGWDLKNYKQNPVLLASHNHRDFPIGMAKEISIDGDKLIFKAFFSKATQQAKEAYQLVKEGILKTFSVGFIPREYDEKNNNRITKAELLEISVVSIPANPEAVVVAKEFKENKLAKDLVKEWLSDSLIKKDVESIERKAVIPFSVHGDTPKAEVGSSWDGPAEIVKADTDKLKKMSSWYDAENADNKTAYKLPHHRADSSDTVVFRGVTAAMAALMGARGGVDIPANDRKGVYNHLAKHYSQFERTAPEFRFILDIYNSASEVLEKDKVNGEEGGGRNINLKILQLAVGHLQEVCKEIKKGGRKNETK